MNNIDGSSSARTTQLLNKIILLLIVFYFTASSSLIAQKKAEWGTYLENNTNSFSSDELVEQIIRVDESGNDAIYAVGITYSASGTYSQCSTTPSLGNGDVFLAKYTTTAGLAPTLAWITYLGTAEASANTCPGSSSQADKYDWGYCLTSDVLADGTTVIYVAGAILSSTTLTACGSTTNDCASNTPYQATAADAWDGFIAAYSTSGSLLRWTYFGGKNSNSSIVDKDEILGIDVRNHNVYVVGYTEGHLSPNGSAFPNPVATKSYCTTQTSSNGEGFIAEFNYCLTSLLFFTYYDVAQTGSVNGQDRARGIRIDPNGSRYIYISGSCSSTSGIAKGAGIFQGSYQSGNQDAFAGKWIISTTYGYAPVWSTYIGGDNEDRGRQIQVIKRNGGMSSTSDVYVSMYTKSSSITGTTTGSYIYSPATLPNYQSGGQSNQDLFDGYLIDLNPTDGSKKWAVYVAGSKYDLVNGIYPYQEDGVPGPVKIAVAGLTNSTDLTSHLYSGYTNAIMPYLDWVGGGCLTNNNNDDAFLAIFKDDGSSVTTDYATYLGGNKTEDFQQKLTCYANTQFTGYGPWVISNNEAPATLYFSFSTPSCNVHKYITADVGYNLKSVGSITCVGASGCSSSHENFDGYIARIVPETPTQHSCPGSTSCDQLKSGNFFSDFFSSTEVSFYPNPFSESVTLQINASMEGDATVDIINIVGQKFKTVKVHFYDGTNQFTIDMDQKQQGVKFANVNILGTQKQFKLVEE